VNVILAAADVIENEPGADIDPRTCIIRRVGRNLVETAEKQRDIIEVLTERDTAKTVDLAGTARSVVPDVRTRYPNGAGLSA